MQSNLSIIILAAGKGTRMKSSIPKVLHKMSGKEMLYYSIEEAQKLSNDIHVVLYHQADLVQGTMEKYFDDVTYHIQDHEKYPGTGGASEWNRFIEEYLDKPSDNIIEKTRKIHDDYIYDFVFDDGRIKNIYLLDKQNIARNKVQVINQFSQKGEVK